jgi:hypothetical protein
MRIKVQLDLSACIGSARNGAASSLAICFLVCSIASACSAPKPPLAKLIGLIQETDDRQSTIAVFRDETSHAVFVGRAGDLILDRYRIRRVTVDAVELVDTHKPRRPIVLTLTGDDEPPHTQKKGRS